mgnify:CR=1 FL=1
MYLEDLRSRYTSLLKDAPIFTGYLESFIPILEEQEERFLWLVENILNLDVAEGYHLDFIGGIVGQSRVLIDFGTEPYFGFKSTNGTEAYQSETLSSQSDTTVGGIWNSLSHTNTNTTRRLTDEEYRRVILARIIYNNCSCTTNSIIEVINLLTNSKNNTVYAESNTVVVKPTGDVQVLDYFISRVDRVDNIIPLPIGVNISMRA